MKKSLLALTVATLCLAGCGKDKELKVKKYDGKECIVSVADKCSVFADDIANKTVYGASGAELIYNEVTKLVTKLAYPASADIKASAKIQLEQWKDEIKQTAENNGTSYAKEEKYALDAKGLKSVKELQAEFEYTLQSKKLTEKFWDSEKNSLYTDYVNEALPYHVSHYLLTTGDVDSLYYLDTIDATAAQKLGYLLEDLADPTQSFASIASDPTYGSDDTGSATEGGDLGIMDLFTSFVSEFKFSVILADYYIKAAQTGFDLNNTPANFKGLVGSLLDTDYYAGGASFIPLSTVSVLSNKSVYSPESDYYKYTNGGGVENVSGSRYYERNTIYNNYFNKPGFSFIEYDSAVPSNAVEGVDYITLGTHKVVAKGGHAVIVTRSSGLGDKGGIHFIVINESPLDADAADYYAPKAKADDNYTSFVEYYGSAKESEKTALLETNVKTAIEYGDSENTSNMNVKLFEKYYNEVKDKITIADNISKILTDHVAEMKDMNEYLAVAYVAETLGVYENRLDSFVYYFNDSHYVPSASLSGTKYTWNTTNGKFE